ELQRHDSSPRKLQRRRLHWELQRIESTTCKLFSERSGLQLAVKGRLTGGREYPIPAVRSAGPMEQLLQGERLLACPIGNRIYVHVRVGGQAMEQIFKPEPNRLRGKILSVVSRGKRFEVPVLGHTVADAQLNVIIWPVVNRAA